MQKTNENKGRKRKKRKESQTAEKEKKTVKKNLSSTRMEKGAEETCPIMMTSIGVGVRAFSSLDTTEWSEKG